MNPIVEGILIGVANTATHYKETINCRMPMRPGTQKDDFRSRCIRCDAQDLLSGKIPVN